MNAQLDETLGQLDALPGARAVGPTAGRQRSCEELALAAAPVMENGFVSRAIPAIPGPARLNHRHEQMLNWMLCNPDRPLSELARDFGYSPSWVNIVVNSDAFQAKYQEMCAELQLECVHTLKAKLTGATVQVIDKITERLEGKGGQPSEKFLIDSSRTLLTAMGFGAKPTAVESSQHIHQHLHVQAGDLTRARELAAQHFAGRSRAVVPASQSEEVAAVA